MINKSRYEVARFIERQLHIKHKLSRVKQEAWHYGIQELRELMDYLFDSPPEYESDGIRKLAYDFKYEDIK